MHIALAVFVVIMYALTIARITRLVNADKITDRLRTYPRSKMTEARAAMNEARLHGHSTRGDMYERTLFRWDKALYFVQCPWCVSMWLALFTAWVPLFFSDNHVVQYIALALAVSHVVGVFARFADTETIEYEEDDALL